MMASTTIVKVRFAMIPGQFTDTPGAYAIADDGGEWRLSEQEIANAFRNQIPTGKHAELPPSSHDRAADLPERLERHIDAMIAVEQARNADHQSISHAATEYNNSRESLLEIIRKLIP